MLRPRRAPSRRPAGSPSRSCSTGRVQERARLVQRDRARDSPDGNLSLRAGEPPGGASERHLLRRQRLLSPRHANHHASCAHLGRPALRFDPGIRTDAKWNGGKVGLALIGVPGSLCPQTKYSQAELNDKSPSGAPWVSALVYQSVAEAGCALRRVRILADVPAELARLHRRPTQSPDRQRRRLQ